MRENAIRACFFFCLIVLLILLIGNLQLQPIKNEAENFFPSFAHTCPTYTYAQSLACVCAHTRALSMSFLVCFSRSLSLALSLSISLFRSLSLAVPFSRSLSLSLSLPLHRTCQIPNIAYTPSLRVRSIYTLPTPRISPPVLPTSCPYTRAPSRVPVPLTDMKYERDML